MEELKFCPFCGSEKFEHGSTSSTMGHGDSGNRTFIRCIGCGVIVTHDGSYFETFDPKRWNVRAQDDIGELIEKLGDAFRGLWVSYTLPLPATEFKTEKQWTVTFLYRGQYCETQLVSTAEKALMLAIERHEAEEVK